MFETIYKSGFNKHINHLRVVDAGVGWVKCKLIVTESDCNPLGTLHGGQTCTLVDVVSTGAIMTAEKPPGVSVDLNVSFMRPAKIGEEIDINSHCLKLGRSLATCVVDILNSSGKMVAQGRHTKFIAR